MKRLVCQPLILIFFHAHIFLTIQVTPFLIFIFCLCFLKCCKHE
ncbi:hypothetical protein [Staphylococcus phage vB_ScaM-V1SC01]|nr:hypothetical protein [Staphylococcus phage vB_ScaM-V1SC01]WPF67603.1 hypothetical protein [Staphylococcus phage vB_SauM-V1SA12]